MFPLCLPSTATTWGRLNVVVFRNTQFCFTHHVQLQSHAIDKLVMIELVLFSPCDISLSWQTFATDIYGANFTDVQLQNYYKARNVMQ